MISTLDTYMKRSFFFAIGALLLFILPTTGRAATYAYDASGRYSAITHPNGQVFYYRYDRAGNLLEVGTDVVAPVAFTGAITRKVGMDGKLDVTGGNPMGAHVYSAQGLPAGLKIDPVTGQIAGRIAADPGNYTFSYWSQAGTQKSDVKTGTIQISGFPVDMIGSFEVLLLDDVTDYPSGKVELDVTDKGVFSGKLLDENGSCSPLSGVLQLGEGTSPATARVLFLAAAGQPVPGIDIAISTDGKITCTKKSGVRQVASGQANARVATGYSTKTPAPWSGTYTLALDQPAWTAGSPDGAGYASAIVAANGDLTLQGKLSDGTPLTASARAATDGTYILFLQPYGKAASYLAGTIKLVSDSKGGYFADLANGSGMFWKKTAQPRDASYRTGFGPLEIEPLMQKWTVTKDVSATVGLPVSGEFGATIWGGGIDSTGNATAATGCPSLPSDPFDKRATIAPGGGVVVGSNLKATKEKDEPVHAFVAGGASVWWQWTPSFSGNVTIETTGSDFDTVLAVYTGKAIKSLTRIAHNDNAGTAITSGLTFNATKGTPYLIAVDGKATTVAGNTTITRGNINLTVTPPATAGRLNNYGVPAALKLDKTNRISTAEKTPVVFTGSVNPSTGIFNGSFVIKDTATSNWQPRAVTRTVKVEGVLFGGTAGDLGAGFFLLPPTSSAGTNYSGQVILTRSLPRAKFQ